MTVEARTTNDQENLCEADPMVPPDSNPNSRELERTGQIDSTDSRHLSRHHWRLHGVPS